LTRAVGWRGVVVTLATHVAAGDGVELIVELIVDERNKVIQNFGVAPRASVAAASLLRRWDHPFDRDFWGTGRESSANLLQRCEGFSDSSRRIAGS
jgi:hypothetical protein